MTETQDMTQSTDTKPVNLQRVANLQATFTKYGRPALGAGWEDIDDSEIPRFVCVETSADGPWFKFADTAADALESFYTDEGDWWAEAVIDLDNGQVLQVGTKAALTGKAEPLAGAFAPAEATPGPWYWSNKGGVLILYREGERGVILRTQPQTGSDYDLTDADAALITAAPDMLQALRDALPIMAHTSPLSVDIIKAIRAAITKAEG